MDYKFQTDAIISRFTRKKVGEKELVPWDSSDNSSDECELDFNSNGWDVNDMFERNERIYGVTSDFDHDLSGYTMSLSIDNTKAYKDAEAKAAKIAKEIENNQTSRTSFCDEDGEEEKYAAVFPSRLSHHYNTKGRYGSNPQINNNKQFKANTVISKPIYIPITKNSSLKKSHKRTPENSSGGCTVGERETEGRRHRMASLGKRDKNLQNLGSEVSKNSQTLDKSYTWYAADESISDILNPSVLDRSSTSDSSYIISKITSDLSSTTSSELEKVISNGSEELFDKANSQVNFQINESKTSEGELFSIVLPASIGNSSISGPVNGLSSMSSLDSCEAKLQNINFSLNPDAKPFIPRSCNRDEISSLMPQRELPIQSQAATSCTFPCPKNSSNNTPSELCLSNTRYSPTTEEGTTATSVSTMPRRTYPPPFCISPFNFQPNGWSPVMVTSHHKKTANHFSQRTLGSLGGVNLYPFQPIHHFPPPQELYSPLPQAIYAQAPLVGGARNINCGFVPNAILVGQEHANSHHQHVYRSLFSFGGIHSHIL